MVFCPQFVSVPKISQFITFKTNELQKIEAFFPQMKPEKKAVELTEDEKAVLTLLKANSPIELDELKIQTGLSNKKWDKAIKGLTGKKVVKVEKTDGGLFVDVV